MRANENKRAAIAVLLLLALTVCACAVFVCVLRGAEQRTKPVTQSVSVPSSEETLAHVLKSLTGESIPVYEKYVSGSDVPEKIITQKHPRYTQYEIILANAAVTVRDFTAQHYVEDDQQRLPEIVTTVFIGGVEVYDFGTGAFYISGTNTVLIEA